MKFNKAIMIAEGKGNKLLLLDIDDTIVKAKGIHIYKKTENGEIALTPDEFAKENVNSENKHLYDLRDFRDAEKVSSSIKKGKPVIEVLNYMDDMIKKGYRIGILTARGMEQVIKGTLQSWLMYKKHGKLRDIGNKLKEVFAVNDSVKKYKGANSFEKKANVMKDLSKRYDKIIFIDDDEKNIQAVNNLHLPNVQAKNVEDI
ncbi:MAG: hypothetical protein ACOC3V_05695 [bacterium]